MEVPETFPAVYFAKLLEAWLKIRVAPIQIEDLTYLRVLPGERLSSAGASIIMAPCTHLSKLTRFSDGTFGVYYAAKTLTMAIEETKFHRAPFWRPPVSPIRKSPCGFMLMR